MGLFDKLMSKVGNAMENSMSKNLQGESKAEYEKEKTERAEEKAKTAAEQDAAKEELQTQRVQATTADMKNPADLLKKINAIDENNVWVGGFDNFKANQNPTFANMLSGNKNLRVLSQANGVFYLSKFQDGCFYAYKKFAKEQVSSCEVEGLMSKSIKIKTNDGTTYSVDVTENKDKLEEIKKALKR